MARLVIFGTGPIGRLAHHYFERDSEHEVAGFTVDAAFRKDGSFQDLPLVDFERVANRFPPRDFKMFIAVAYGRLNRLRAEKFFRAKELGYDLVSYISSRCTFLSDTPVGENCFILEDNTIQPFVRIGNNVTLWSGSHIGHDAVIEDHCFITSHVVISGFVHVHPYCFIGVNASLRHEITIAPRTLIGAGAVIMKDTVEDGVYVPPRATLIQVKSHEVNL